MNQMSETMSESETESNTAPPTFDSLPLSQELRQAVDELGYTHPTPVQRAVFEGLEGAHDGLLLLDAQGLRVGGGLSSPEGTPVGDAVAAHLAGVFRDAERAARLLSLGSWSSVAAETSDANLFLCAPTPDSLLLLVRDSSVPIGRLALQAERASEAARRWLEGTP